MEVRTGHERRQAGGSRDKRGSGVPIVLKRILFDERPRVFGAVFYFSANLFRAEEKARTCRSCRPTAPALANANSRSRNCWLSCASCATRTGPSAKPKFV